MSHEQLSKHKCPQCGGDMETGYIAGHWIRLRWCETENTKTILAGTPLRKKRDWINAPSVEATRCDKCGVGMFSFDK